MWSACQTVSRRAAILFIVLYQNTLSLLVLQSCKSSPSCSAYAVTALQRYGILRAAPMIVRRLWRCRPFALGGPDPVP
ncbi:MAG: membrane protein insertion efficiency factor YidD [Candidatus Omnitrophica bacterium CG11_big_fil_rev_8_21_14_0_20_63_9]|nr:MAG: membrane protein insertion efficiency factor YidD [Candidatus Omnitrophica bacterium CG11_big_fil_rev_8_21_14_0_20_63_9]